jgi:hypothetical protein
MLHRPALPHGHGDGATARAARHWNLSPLAYCAVGRKLAAVLTIERSRA